MLAKDRGSKPRAEVSEAERIVLWFIVGGVLAGVFLAVFDAAFDVLATFAGQW